MDRAAVASHYRNLGYAVEEDVVLVGASGSQHRAELLADGPGGRLVVFFAANGLGPLRRIADDVGATPVLAAPVAGDDERRADALGILLLAEAALGSSAQKFSWLAPRKAEPQLAAQASNTGSAQENDPREGGPSDDEMEGPTPVSLGAPPPAESHEPDVVAEPPSAAPWESTQAEQPDAAGAPALPWRPAPTAPPMPEPAAPLAPPSPAEAAAAQLAAGMVKHIPATVAMAEADLPPLRVPLVDVPRRAEVTIQRVHFESRGPPIWLWLAVVAGLLGAAVLVFLLLL